MSSDKENEKNSAENDTGAGSNSSPAKEKAHGSSDVNVDANGNGSNETRHEDGGAGAKDSEGDGVGGDTAQPEKNGHDQEERESNANADNDKKDDNEGKESEDAEQTLDGGDCQGQQAKTGLDEKTELQEKTEEPVQREPEPEQAPEPERLPEPEPEPEPLKEERVPEPKMELRVEIRHDDDHDRAGDMDQDDTPKHSQSKRKRGDDLDEEAALLASDIKDPDMLDPRVASDLDFIKSSKPESRLEIVLVEALHRKEAHIERLSGEVQKLKAFISKRKQTYKRKRKDEGAPTRALSAYNIFVQDRFARLAKENEAALRSADSDAQLKRVPPANLVASTGNEWKGLPPDEKAKYEERAKTDRKRYEEQMAQYQPPDKQANRKRNKTGYNMFFSAHVLRLKQSEMGVPSERGSVARLVGTAWKQLSAEEKQYYEREADKHNGMNPVEKDGDDDEDEEAKRQQQVGDPYAHMHDMHMHGGMPPPMHPGMHQPPQHDPRHHGYAHYPPPHMYGQPPHGYYDYGPPPPPPPHTQGRHQHGRSQGYSQGYPPQHSHGYDQRQMQM